MERLEEGLRNGFLAPRNVGVIAHDPMTVRGMLKAVREWKMKGEWTFAQFEPARN